jgi:pimeloyl-ACP methyl ester carboxylesterase
VVCLPGGVAPVAQRYAALAEHIRGRASLHLKDLEVYRDDSPPAGYTVEMELEAIDRFAQARGLERFHLLGYSGGGFLSLAYAGTRPERVASLAVFEPAMVPGLLSPEEQSMYESLDSRLRGLTGSEFMGAFVQAQVKPGVAVPPPPAGPAPPWMVRRPAGIQALLASFFAFDFDRARFRACQFPVFLGYGDHTHEIEEVKAGVLARLLPDFRVRRMAGVHHFVPPELIYTRGHSATLLALWTGAAASA